jgi:hypothetical protein
MLAAGLILPADNIAHEDLAAVREVRVECEAIETVERKLSFSAFASRRVSSWQSRTGSAFGAPPRASRRKPDVSNE